MRTLVALSLLWPTICGAQTLAVPPPPRIDLTGTVGWLHAPFDPLATDFFRDQDWTRHATGTAAAGVYWTEHWKTEMSVAFSTEADAWDGEVIQRGDEVAQRSVIHRVRYTRGLLAQFYQFRRNEWVHPSLGIGVLLQRRSGHSEYSPAVVYRGPTGAPLTIAPEERRELAAETVAAPFVSAAIKAYVTPRAFFRGDVQVAAGRDVESVVLHAGFGVDF
jgi:hypothetical protein